MRWDLSEPLDAGMLIGRVRLEPPHCCTGDDGFRQTHDAASWAKRSGLQIRRQIFPRAHNFGGPAMLIGAIFKHDQSSNIFWHL
jgi:hypothetical protein